MTEQTEHFAFSFMRLFYTAGSIVVAPLLLYLFQIWSLPPTVFHYLVFAIAFALAVRFWLKNWQVPQLTIEADRFTCEGETFLFRDIELMKPSVRSLKLVIATEDDRRVRNISLQWAGRGDVRRIKQILSDRLNAQRELVA